MENIIDNYSAAQFIQFMLAPAIMISACGLLLLGINNKYSIIVNRIRLLNKEKREFIESKGINSIHNNIRFDSVDQQIKYLEKRVWLVRNAVLSYAVAVALFVITSVSLGMQSLLQNEHLQVITISLFLIGMLSVFIGITFTFLETSEGYKIVQFEIESANKG